MTDPEHPELLRFLDGPPGTMTIQVQVADGIMITALEYPPPGLIISGLQLQAAADEEGRRCTGRRHKRIRCDIQQVLARNLQHLIEEVVARGRVR